MKKSIAYKIRESCSILLLTVSEKCKKSILNNGMCVKTTRYNCRNVYVYIMRDMNRDFFVVVQPWY